MQKQHIIQYKTVAQPDLYVDNNFSGSATNPQQQTETPKKTTKPNKTHNIWPGKGSGLFQQKTTTTGAHLSATHNHRQHKGYIAF